MYQRILIQYTPEGVYWMEVDEGDNEQLIELFPDCTVEELYGEAVTDRLRQLNSLNLGIILSRAAVVSRDYNSIREMLN